MTSTGRSAVTGYYCGAASRAASAVLDVALVFGLFTIGVAGFDMLSSLFFGVSFSDDRSSVLWIVVLSCWAFLYFAVSLVVAGRTLGKGIVGLRVVLADGSPVTPGRAVVRTLALPFSILFFGLGLIGIFVQREHRAFHDLVAGTAVVYDWGKRVAELPGPLSAFLAKRAETDATIRQGAELDEG